MISSAFENRLSAGLV